MATPTSPDPLHTDTDFATLATLRRSEDKSKLYSRKNSGPRTVVFGKILLNEDISPANFYTSWIFVAYLGFIMISSSSLEPEYISKILHVQNKDLGKATAELYLCDYMVRLLFALIYGIMIDFFGRRFVMTIGVLITSLGYFLIPLLGTSLFPRYYLAKSVFSIGIISLQMLPFAADYVHNKTKGIMTGLTFGVGFCGGAIAAGVIKLLLFLGCSYKLIYWIFALIILVVGYLLWPGIKGGNQYYKIERSEIDIEVSEEATRWQEVKLAYKKIPWITIALIFGVLGNTDLYIMTTGLIIWLKALVPAGEDPTLIATNYQAIFFGISFIVTATLALKVDKIPHMKVIFPILVVSTLGFITVPFIRSAHSALFYVFFLLEGLSLPGILVYSTYLSARYTPPRIRGTVSGISNIFGFIGAILILSLGGYLRDHWRNDASFLIYWMLLGLTLIIVAVLYIFKLRNKTLLAREVSVIDLDAIDTGNNSDRDIREYNI